MNWPALSVGVITYNRPSEIRETLTALFNNLHYSGPLTYIIADDCSPGSYLSDLEAWVIERGTSPPGHDFRVLRTDSNVGWGGNANNLIRFAARQSGLLYMTEDDYVLTRPLDLDVGVSVLLSEPHLGMLRYRSTAGVPMIYRQHEANIERYLPDYREHEAFTQARANWLELDPASDTLWLYSNGPHLKRYDFHEVYGLYPEGLKLGTTEEAYAHMVKDRLLTYSGALRIGVLPEWIPMHYRHIGKSYQLTEHDKGVS